MSDDVKFLSIGEIFKQKLIISQKSRKIKLFQIGLFRCISILRKTMIVSPRVLSIQSHVVSGYVGNKSAVFPMQVLGLEVDFINSVQFSNHTGYPIVKGQILAEKDITELMQGLYDNNIDTYSHLLTGYIRSASFLKEICNIVKNLKNKNPDLVYVCDPVMGDNGKLYVPEELLPIYKEYVLPLTTILTPNLFEAELLTDTKINDITAVWKAIDILHRKNCQTVVITSAELTGSTDLSIFASTTLGDQGQRFQMEVQKLPMNFTGTGDLFSSLFLSWMHKTSNNLKESLERTVSTLQAVIKRTLDSVKGQELTPKNKELKLVQSKSDIENPTIIFSARKVE